MEKSKRNLVIGIVIAVTLTATLITILIVGGSIYTQNSYINWKKEEDARKLSQEQQTEALRVKSLRACQDSAYEAYLEAYAKLCNLQTAIYAPKSVGVYTFTKEYVRSALKDNSVMVCLLFEELAKQPLELSKRYDKLYDDCLKLYPSK